MPVGPGKYDDLCTTVREAAQAVGAIVIILAGKKGSGFSIQVHDTLISPTIIADMLEHMARQMRADNTEPDTCPWCKVAHTGMCSRLVGGGQTE